MNFNNETANLLYQKYGLTLNTKQLAEVLHYKTTRVLLNSISSGTCPVKTMKIGKHRVAHVLDVAEFFDRARSF